MKPLERLTEDQLTDRVDTLDVGEHLIVKRVGNQEFILVTLSELVARLWSNSASDSTGADR